MARLVKTVMNTAMEYAKAKNIIAVNCAETGADILLTTDIKFLRGCQRIKSGISVKNPVEFIMKVFRYDESDDEYC